MGSTTSASAPRRRISRGWLPSLPADVHPVARPEYGTKESHQMGGGPAVRQQIDRRPVDVVVLVLQGLFFQTVDKHLEISLGDAADELIRRCVIKINHRKVSPVCSGSA